VRRLQRLLDATPVDRDAEERVWQVVRAAYAEREPARRRRPRYALAAVALAVAVVAAALSPPGRAVVDAMRRSLAVEHAAPALFRLPAAGRLLVSGPGGTWIVNADGSKRRLGDWTQAAWSPHALYVVAASENELATVEPGGTVHWKLARPHVAFPRWGGSRADTRIAYLTAGRLHVVAGDGTGDRAIGPAARVAPAWQPGDRHVLAYVRADGRMTVLEENGVRWSAPAHPGPRALAWSRDGGMLALATRTNVVVFNAETTHQQAFPIAGVRAIAFARDGRLTLLRGRTVLELRDGVLHTLFTAPGPLAGLAWSPEGKWLATAVPAADQLLFVGRRVVAVSNIRAQLGGAVSLDGWAPAT
jgi:hypothetical protein